MVFEHVVYDSGHFLGDNGSGDGPGRFSGFGVVESLDFGIRANGMDGDFAESKFEIFIAIFVPDLCLSF
jgi:hypothetical protein